MLDIQFIRNNPDKVREGIKKKRIDPKRVDEFLARDKKWREIITELDGLRSRQNEITARLSKERDVGLIEEAKALKTKIQNLSGEERIVQDERNGILNNIPNIPFEDVLVGKNETENKVLREVGRRRNFQKEGFLPKDYLTLAEQLGIINVKKAAEVTGSRFGYLLGDGAMLELALVDFAIKTLRKEGFYPAIPPVMIKPEVYEGIGRLAADQREERFFIEKDEKYLVGTAEHTLIPLQMDETREESELPIRYVGFSSAFRREAGSYGKDTKGILRVHQFDKVEMISFTTTEESDREFHFLSDLQEKLWKALEIPYRVLEICTGDMGWTDARQSDIEAWLPGQNAYRETNSCSNTTDFQTRGIQARYRMRSGETRHMHALNATAFAIGRTIIAIIENYQTKEGFVEVPKVLRKYVGKKVIR
ncbi:serine--tRNA ligase [Candidatus Jorgensenbacteria bacterium RIFCSPLOWO2_01_FULL_45_25b]|uniref:Serine--tRNA ligase n=1 Tax=Candidatus Jorgensenbacteria bacterium RIFCSPLOWO2_01_FULL_45_25b TaxID=1798471 RepID=A0A1F6BWT3_9BACT|nr:MAG: serine--tRNA ligase [Candidatus Jorgensenbacteria bacterium RIFCSPLOWO2_01_FULL_45_25b]